MEKVMRIETEAKSTEYIEKIKDEIIASQF